VNENINMLARMFELQKDLQRRLGTPLVGIEARERAPISPRTLALPWLSDDEKSNLRRWHKEFSLALMMESSELMDWSPWKTWSKQLGNKQQVAEFSNEHVTEVLFEVADCFHFLINICLVYGITPEDLFESFTNKNKVNHTRQDGGSY
jgi:dimeric dUTPase (all-alpha-NTP-PPase superfamily)